MKKINVISIVILMFFLGCSSNQNIFAIDDLNNLIHYNFSENVNSVPNIDNISKYTEKYKIKKDNMTCYFLEETPRSSLIISHENIDILRFILSNEHFEELSQNFNRFMLSDNIGAETYYYDSYEVWFFYNTIKIPYIRIYF